MVPAAPEGAETLKNDLNEPSPLQVAGNETSAYEAEVISLGEYRLRQRAQLGRAAVEGTSLPAEHKVIDLYSLPNMLREYNENFSNGEIATTEDLVRRLYYIDTKELVLAPILDIFSHHPFTEGFPPVETVRESNQFVLRLKMIDENPPHWDEIHLPFSGDGTLAYRNGSYIQLNELTPKDVIRTVSRAIGEVLAAYKYTAEQALDGGDAVEQYADD